VLAEAASEASLSWALSDWLIESAALSDWAAEMDAEADVSSAADAALPAVS